MYSLAAHKFCPVTLILKSLHWLKINEYIEYKLLSLTYKTLTTAQPTYLHSLISVQPSPCYSLLICCHPFSTTYIFFSKNHQSLVSLCINHLISGINFLSRFVSLAYSTLLMLSHSLIHLPPAHHSHPSCISETADHLFNVSNTAI